MARKLIYFVRHGETESNAQGIRQGSEGSLTQRGRSQAIETAKKFPKIGEKGCPETLISSPWTRTRETAEIISAELGLSIEYSDLLVERKNPSEIVERSGDDRDVRKIVDRMDKSFHPDEFRYSDEENFIDLKERARKLIKYIKHRPESRIIMVTHGIFLKMIIAYMMYGKSLTAPLYNKLSFFNPIDNAGTTVVQYIPHWFKRSEWKLLVWNDNLVDSTPKEP